MNRRDNIIDSFLESVHDFTARGQGYLEEQGTMRNSFVIQDIIPRPLRDQSSRNWGNALFVSRFLSKRKSV